MDVEDLELILDGSINMGLGLCLQCTAEYKMGSGDTLSYGCITVGSPQGPVASCYDHLQVQKAPSPLDPRMQNIPLGLRRPKPNGAA